MTKQQISMAGIMLAMSATLTSCYTFSKGTVVRADDYDAETIVDLMNEEEPVVKVSSATRPNTPSKREVTATPFEGEWNIVKVGKKTINTDDDMPYVVFSDKDGRFYASNGCNIINGQYEYKGKLLTFSSVLTTMRACPDIQYPDEISRVLKDGVSVNAKIEERGTETYLYLLSANGDALLTLRRHNLETINGHWYVTYLGQEDIDGEDIDLFFDIPERKIHGNTGCNFFNGEIVIDPHHQSAIAFSHMGVTMRYCDKSDIERRLLVALEETETYTLKDANTLYLNDINGHRLLTLRRDTQNPVR